MKFKVDENLPAEIAEVLRESGHDGVTVAEQDLSGANDRKLWDVCRGENRALVTQDFDFADIRRYPPRAHVGVLILNPAKADKFTLIKMARRIAPELTEAKIRGTLWIVEDTRIRVREG